MSRLIGQFEGIDVYYQLNEESSLYLLITGFFDTNTLSNIFQTFSYLNPKSICTFEGIYFISLNTTINYFNQFIKKRLEIFHLNFFSIFLKQNLINSKIQHFHNIENNIFYVYYENKNNKNDEINKVKNSIYFQKISTDRSKYLYGFEKYSDLIAFYSEIIKDESNWPIYAILPPKTIQYNRKNKHIYKQNSIPHFIPIKTLFYISFIEREIPKSLRKMNVKKMYSINQIQDAQISHLTTENLTKRNIIRTFLGFDSKIRCFHVLDFLNQSKIHSNSIYDIKIIENDNFDKFIDIKHNLFYLAVQSQFNLSICFSINYQDSFNLIENNALSTIFSFKNINDFLMSKKIFYSSLMNKKIHFIIKNINAFDEDEFEVLFQKQSAQKMKYIMFRVKQKKESNDSNQQINFSSLLKSPSMFQKDLVCTLDDKKYVVVGFKSIEDREKSISMLKKSVYFKPFKSYFPELATKQEEKEKININEVLDESLLQYDSNSIVSDKKKVKNNNNRFRFTVPDDDLNDSNQKTIDKEELIQNSLNNNNNKKNDDNHDTITSNSIHREVLANNNNENNYTTNPNKNGFKKIENNNKNRFRYRVTDDSNKKEENIQNNDQKCLNDTNPKTSEKLPELTSNSDKNLKYADNKRVINDLNNKLPSNIMEHSTLETKFYTTHSNEEENKCFTNLSHNQSEYNSNDLSNDNQNNQSSNSNNYSNNPSTNNSNNRSNDTSNNHFNNNSNNQSKNNSNDQPKDHQNNESNNYSSIQSKNSNNKSKAVIKNTNCDNSTNNKNLNITENKKEISNDLNETKESPKTIISEEDKMEDYYYSDNVPQKIDINDFKPINGKLLGKGSFGTVTLVEHKKTQKKYAAKKSINKNSQKSFLLEIEFYSHHKCPFILKLIGYTEDSTMILEYMPNGSLQTFLDKSRKDPKIKKLFEKKKYIILYGIVYGMSYLHFKNIIHRDLKPDNILLDENYYPQISDFGTAFMFNDEEKRKKQEKEIVGTVIYSAPEIFIEEKPYTNKVDVYSFAIIAYELLTGEPPFKDLGNINKRKFVKKIQKGFRPDISKIEDEWMKIFLQRCWSPDSTERPTFDDIFDFLMNDHIKLAYKMNLDEYSKFLDYIKSQNPSFNKDEGFKTQIYHAKQLLESENIPEQTEGYIIAQELADKGDQDAMKILADYLFSQKSDLKQSCIYYKKTADLGNSESMVMYGNCRLKGIGSTIDLTEAAAYYKKAADLGNHEAMFNYAHMLQFGKGVKKDINEALEYYQMAANSCNLNAMYQLAYTSEKLTYPPNYDLAIKYYKKAAYYGDIGAALNLGILLSSGLVPEDLKTAKYYLKEAAKNEEPKSAFAYAQLLFQIALTTNCNKEDMLNYIKKAKKNYKKAKQLGDSKSENYYNLTKSLLNKPFINDIDQLKKRAFDGLQQLSDTIITPTTIKTGDIEVHIINPLKIRYEDSIFLKINKKAENNEVKKENYPIGKAYIPKIEPTRKSIERVNVNLYQSFEMKDMTNLFFFISQNTLPQRMLNTINKTIKSIRGVRKVINRCFAGDPNDLYTFYLFSSMNSFINAYSSILDIIERNHIKKYFFNGSLGSIISNLVECKNDPVMMMLQMQNLMMENNFPFNLPTFNGDNTKINNDNSEYLYFDESLIPPNKLDVLIKYLHTVKEITDIKRNVFNGEGILTYIFVKKDKEKSVISLIRNFLSANDDILFEKHNYPLQNVIIFNESLILNDKNDFDVILNEIQSIGLKPINVERNKLYSYDFCPMKKLFQVFSFICFSTEKEKMEALNHINSIVYKGKKNILHYNLDLTYARIDETCIAPHAIDKISDLFRYFKGFEDIQRNVLSIENPIAKTYIGFDQSKHMKKCYYKFVYRLNLTQFCPDAKLLCKKKGLKYMYVFTKANSYKYIMNRVSSLADDIQENCIEAETVEKNKSSDMYELTYIGFETKEELKSAIERFENDPNVNENDYGVYHEGNQNINISDDPKESYMFYNSL